LPSFGLAMAIFMTSSLMGLVGFELIGIAISQRIYRGAACVQRRAA
jgi:hypothetical protein